MRCLWRYSTKSRRRFQQGVSSWRFEANVDGVPRRNDDERVRAQVRPQPSQQSPPAADPAVASRASRRPLQRRDLVPERQVLERQRMTRLQRGAERRGQRGERVEYA